MTWSDFYLFCFLVGFSLSVLSFLAGAVHIHLPFKWHLPLHGPHHGVGLAKGGLSKGASSGLHISWLAFLAWFGGTGYILTRHSHLFALMSFSIAAVAGLFAGWTVFKFMVRLVHTTDRPMTSEDRRVEGALGTLSMSIRENGTGEVIFTLGGTRRCAGARSGDGKPIERGAEVLIERYEKGIAYVKRWEELSK